MRVYIPATREDLDAADLRPQLLHAVTPALRELFPGEDEEVLEMIAHLAAADDSARLVGLRGSVPQRLVLAADVTDSELAPPPDPVLQTVLLATGPVPWSAVVALHVDEVAARAEVAAAAAGDDDAFERVSSRDLLWFDATERGAATELLDS